MNNKKDISSLIDSINHISLNSEDLMEAVLEFTELYLKEHSSQIKIIDAFFGNNDFKWQSTMVAREGIVMAMNAIALDADVSWKEICARCINIEAQRLLEKNICSNQESVIVLRSFMTQLRKELFSRVYSKNKDFNKAAALPKSVLKQRYDYFMKNEF